MQSTRHVGRVEPGSLHDVNASLLGVVSNVGVAIELRNLIQRI